MGDISAWIGYALQLLGILGGVGAFFYRIHLSLNMLMHQNVQAEKEIATMKVKMEQLSQVITDIARQDARLNYIEARVQELSNILLARFKADV